MTGTLPNIFAYTDYRVYLRDYYQARKTQERKFSHRLIAEKIHVSSSGWFADILKGRLNLTGGQLVPLVRFLQLKPNEIDYFEALVGYAQSGSLEEKTRYLQKMLAFKEVMSELVGIEKLEYFSKWYHTAIRELLFFYPFRGDYAALARKLSPPIRQSEAMQSIELLQRLDFVEPNGIGGVRSKDASLKKDPSFPSSVMAGFHKANMELAIEALDRYSKEERDVSGLTISLSEDAFKKVKEEIRSLRKRIVAMSEVDRSPTKVYQCNFQFFPMSQ